jgi:hypothetical protein
MIGLALALDQARTTPLGCLPKLRMVVPRSCPLYVPDQPTTRIDRAHFPAITEPPPA